MTHEEWWAAMPAESKLRLVDLMAEHAHAVTHARATTAALHARALRGDVPTHVDLGSAGVDAGEALVTAQRVISFLVRGHLQEEA